MKKNILSVILFIVITFIGLSFLYLIPFILPELSTKYSEKFDLYIFEKITMGENRHEVDMLLGKPLYISRDNVNKDSIKINYWYSQSKTLLMEYDKVVIQFYDDRVIKKTRVLDGH